jgi:hypothetical protein
LSRKVNDSQPTPKPRPSKYHNVRGDREERETAKRPKGRYNQEFKNDEPANKGNEKDIFSRITLNNPAGRGKN